MILLVSIYNLDYVSYNNKDIIILFLKSEEFIK